MSIANVPIRPPLRVLNDFCRPGYSGRILSISRFPGGRIALICSALTLVAGNVSQAETLETTSFVPATPEEQFGYDFASYVPVMRPVEGTADVFSPAGLNQLHMWSVDVEAFQSFAESAGIAPEVGLSPMQFIRPDGSIVSFDSAQSMSDYINTYDALAANLGNVPSNGALYQFSSFDAIRSQITGNSVSYNGAVDSLFCGSTGLGGSYDSTLAIYHCLFGAAQGALPAAQQINQLNFVDFQFNRPTSEMARSLNLMRGMRVAQRKTDEEIQGTNGGASGDQYLMLGNLGLFFSAGGSFGDVNTRQSLPGYAINRRTVTVGPDYQVTDWLRTGLLFNYVSTSSDLVQGLGTFRADSFRFTPFLTFIPFENAYVDLTIGYALHDNRSERRSFGVNYEANYTGDEYSAALGAGYNFNWGGLSVIPYVQAAGISTEINRFREQSDSGVGITMGKQYRDSVTTTVGTELNYVWSTPYGVVLPRVFGEWVHEYRNSSQSITNTLGRNGFATSFVTPDPIRNWANVGFGAQFVMPNSVSAFVNYTSLIISGATNHTLEGGVRWDF